MPRNTSSRRYFRNALNRDRRLPLLPAENGSPINFEELGHRIERKAASLPEVGKCCLSAHAKLVAENATKVNRVSRILCRREQKGWMVKSATMAKVTKIHQGKQPVRRHYLAEWLEAKQMTPTDLLDVLNDPDRSMGLTEVDKSQVYRWIKGQMPQPAMQMRIAGALGFENEPDKLLQDPTMDWLSDFFRDKTEEQKEKAVQMLKLLFADIKTGTDG